MKRIALIRASAILAASMLCAPIGCGGNLPTPSQDAIAINGAGAICAIVLTNDGDSTGAASCVTISGQLATAIKNFVPGSPTQNIVQLGDDLVTIIQADTNSKAADEIAIILGTILNIVGNYTSPAAVVAGIAAPQTARPAIAAPRTKAQLYAAYNAALATHPVPGLKNLK